MIEGILERVDVKAIAVGLVVVFALVNLNTWFTNYSKIRALGGYAHRIKTWLPGGRFSCSSGTRQLLMRP
jgi:hypothetical protein